MLTHLSVKDVVTVADAELDLTQGFTVLTGETGAGKSILIDALSQVLGARAETSLIRNGSKCYDITAVFTIDSLPQVVDFLQTHNVELEDQELLIRRVLSVEGRSKTYINAQLVPLQLLRELRTYLVHFCGQHQQINLIQADTCRQQLDAYAGHEDLVTAVRDAYEEYKKIEKSYQALQNQSRDPEKLALLQFQIEELQALDLKADELQCLHQTHKRLHNAKAYLESSNNAYCKLHAEEQSAICSQLHQIKALLVNIPDLNNVCDMLNNALIQCEEAAVELASFANAIDIAPESLAQVEQRMGLIHQMARKYQQDPHDLQNYAEQLQARAQVLAREDVQAHKLGEELKHAEETYQKHALKLRQSRVNYAQQLSREITTAIRKLGMERASLQIVCTPLAAIGAHGTDRLDYHICTNPGTQMCALSNIASGGELSRISLAIETVTAQKVQRPTLVFDEVDVGIGGATAAVVGLMLRCLGKKHQIFCVTHQAQVAALAHQHLQVKKHHHEDQTLTVIESLNKTCRLDELARMLGGISITEHTKKHAAALMAEAD